MEDKIKVFIFDYDETLYYNVDWTFFLNRNYQFLINHLKTLNLNDNQIENLLRKHDCFNQPGKLSVAPILTEVEGSCKAWVEFNEKQPPDFARLHNSIAVPNSELAKFAKNGKCYIVSNSRKHDIIATMKYLGIDRSLFQKIYSNDFSNIADTSKSKYFKGIMNLNNASPDQVLVIGDSFTQDILPAQKLGMKTYQCQNGFTYEDVMKDLMLKDIDIER